MPRAAQRQHRAVAAEPPDDPHAPDHPPVHDVAGVDADPPALHAQAEARRPDRPAEVHERGSAAVGRDQGERPRREQVHPPERGAALEREPAEVLAQVARVRRRLAQASQTRPLASTPSRSRARPAR